MIFMTILSNLLTVIATLLVILLGYYKWSFQYWKRKNVPSLEPSIPFGNIQNLLTRNISRMEELTNLYRTIKQKGYKYCGIHQLTDPALFVLDLDLLKRICVKDFEHFVDRGFYYNEKDDPISCHLLAIEGNRWKNLRSKASTIFTATKLKSMLENLLECGANMEAYIDNVIESGTQPLNARDVAASFTADAVGSSTMGIKCRSFTDPDQNFIKFGRQVLELDRTGQFLFLLSLLFPNMSRKLGVRQVKKCISDFFYKVITETVISRKTKNIERKDLLQLLMGLNNSETNEKEPAFTMDNLVASCFGLFIGGFETSSSSLSFCILEIARYQEIQDKVREEIKAVLGRYNNEITFEALTELKYMQQVLDETWRLFPPVHTINRVCTKDYKVPGENLTIEKGTKVFTTITGIHRDSDYYENPEEFDPERFSDENRKRIPSYAFVPFGAGPRMCVGERYGIMVLKTVLSLLLRRYRITLDKRTKLPIQLDPTALVPLCVGGVWVNFEKLPSVV